MTDVRDELLGAAGGVTVARVLAVVGVVAVLYGALAPWSFNTVGFERPGFRVGMVLAVVGAVAVVAGPRHPLGAALAVVGGVRAAHPALQRVLWSLGGEMWFAGFVWTGAGALLLVLAGVVSGVVVLRNWTAE